jgi:hypothetical protein
MALHKLVFDTTDAASIANSANVGAFLRAAGGDLITSITQSGNEHLHVAGFITDETGAIVNVTANALDVNITNASLAVTFDGSFDEDTAHVSGDAGMHVLAVRQDTLASSTSADGDYGSLKLDANGSLYVKDSAANTTLSSILSELQGTLDVNITNASVTVSDAALANTALSNEADSVTTTSAALVTSVLASRKYVFIYNNDNKIVYLGAGTVTSANGFPLFPGSILEARIGAAVAINAIASSGTADVRILQAS